jgi:hypothetical protein
MLLLLRLFFSLYLFRQGSGPCRYFFSFLAAAAVV